jgi:hypothetical protein
MSNILLRQLRVEGVITGYVLPFAGLAAALLFARRSGYVVILVRGATVGRFWAVTEADAARLEASGWARYGGQDLPHSLVH